MCVVCSVDVRAFVSKFFTSSWMITIFTHTFCIKSLTCVRAWCNFLFILNLNLLLRLFALAHTSLSSTRQLRTQTLWGPSFRPERLIYLENLNILQTVTCNTILNRWHILQLVIDLFWMWGRWSRFFGSRHFLFCATLNYRNFVSLTSGWIKSM